MIWPRSVHRVNFIICAAVWKHMCRAFYQINVWPKISAKIIELTFLSDGWKTHVFPSVFWAVYMKKSNTGNSFSHHGRSLSRIPFRWNRPSVYQQMVVVFRWSQKFKTKSHGWGVGVRKSYKSFRHIYQPKTEDISDYHCASQKGWGSVLSLNIELCYLVLSYWTMKPGDSIW